MKYVCGGKIGRLVVDVLMCYDYDNVNCIDFDIVNIDTKIKWDHNDIIC